MGLFDGMKETADAVKNISEKDNTSKMGMNGQHRPEPPKDENGNPIFPPKDRDGKPFEPPKDKDGNPIRPRSL